MPWLSGGFETAVGYAPRYELWKDQAHMLAREGDERLSGDEQSQMAAAEPAGSEPSVTARHARTASGDGRPRASHRL